MVLGGVGESLGLCNILDEVGDEAVFVMVVSWGRAVFVYELGVETELFDGEFDEAHDLGCQLIKPVST